MTNYAGELVQHDSSNHLWAPLAGRKWYLITSVDDYSRYLLYADLWEKETSWSHIVAVNTVVTRFGCPLKYYVDNHAIFRFIERRGVVRGSFTEEEEAFIQWKEVLKDLKIGITYALSAPAKGKVERPYRWLQDHLVRTCVREGITKIDQAREVLYEELNRYNNKWVHSTTKEVPAARFERAVKEKKTLFRTFEIGRPYKSADDIFCYRVKRVVDGYRRISFNAFLFSVPPGVSVGDTLELRISFDLKTQMALIRFWHHEKFLGQQQVKAEDIKKVQF